MRTDHQALVWLFSLKEPKGRIARWIEILSAYDFNILHRPGKKHGNADSMSRYPIPDIETKPIMALKCGPCKKCVKRSHEMESSLPIDKETPIRAVTRSQSQRQEDLMWTTWKNIYTPDKIAQMQKNDLDICLIQESLEKDQKPKIDDLRMTSHAAKYYFNLWNTLQLVNGVVYKKFLNIDGSVSQMQLLTPTCLKQEVMKHAHDSILSGHLGRKRTLKKIQNDFFWFEMREDVEIYISKCDVCAQNKIPNRKPRGPQGSIAVGAPLERLSIDTVGPLPRTPRNNRYFLTVVDNFTKWAEVYPIPDQTAETCAHTILNEFISRYGCPDSLHSDQGSAFESELFREFCKVLEIRKTRTSSKNPKGNGQCERLHRTILQMLRAYLKNDQTDWDKYLGCIMAAYRASVNETTKFTPNMMMLGHEVKTPLNLVFGSNFQDNTLSYGDYVTRIRCKMNKSHDLCRRHLQSVNRRRKEQCNTKICMNSYTVGDAVWYLNEQRKEGICPKLQSLYVGPCVVLNKFNDINYCIQLTEDGPVRVVNHDKLKPYDGENLPKWGSSAVKTYMKTLKSRD